MRKIVSINVDGIDAKTFELELGDKMEITFTLTFKDITIEDE